MTKYFCSESKFFTLPHTVWKNEKFTLTEEKFRQINYLVISLVKPLLSRNFCLKCVRVNFRNFHSVWFSHTVLAVFCEKFVKPTDFLLCESFSRNISQLLRVKFWLFHTASLWKSFHEITRISKVGNTDFEDLLLHDVAVVVLAFTRKSVFFFFYFEKWSRSTLCFLLLHSAWCHTAASEGVTIIAKKMPPWWEVNGG